MEGISVDTGNTDTLEVEVLNENADFDDVLSEIDSTRSVELANSEPPNSNAPVSVINLQGPRKSTRLLKVQGLNTSILRLAMKRAREKHLEETPAKGNPLIDAFPFNRLTSSEIVSLFEVYRISLGQTEAQREFVISNMRTCPRPSFENIIHQALQLTKDSDIVIVDSDLGLSCCVK